MSDRIDDLTEMTNAAIKESLRQQHENAEIGAKWRTDSSLETWFPLTAELIVQKDEEIAKLRAELSEIQDFARFVVRDEPDVTPRRAMIRQCEELAKLSAELAAIKAAPVSAPRAEPRVEREPSEAIYPSESHAVPLADCRMCGASVDFVCRDGDWLARCPGCGLTLGEPHGYSSRLDLCRDWNRVVEREPSDDDYKQIYTLAKQFAFIDISDDTSYVVNGRAMWQAVREVMGGEVGR